MATSETGGLTSGRDDDGSVLIRLRMSAHDAHYGGNLVDGARILGLFGDVATELLIRHDGDEGLFVAYDLVEFKAPVYAGDYIPWVLRILRSAQGGAGHAMPLAVLGLTHVIPRRARSSLEAVSPALPAK